MMTRIMQDGRSIELYPLLFSAWRLSLVDALGVGYTDEW